ncbi:dual OB domain-containing protein [Zobellia alginiliquefaciens]|uniref:dual OB domain-containing protein n=1 Tax=Zobellia alginiliquefaciens TaxID=3032586 RepID=UPI0023E36A9B|nr:hypothetical protein [Zobellia alginiliquefaciens]
MRILITSKTRYGSKHACVGGLNLENKSFVRLLNPGGIKKPEGWYQFLDTPLNIGDIWDIDIKISPYTKAPHIEDVFIGKKTKIEQIDDLDSFIKESGVEIWEGHIDKLFDGCLSWLKNGSGYLAETQDEFPKYSVGFWVSDKDLILHKERYFYKYKTLGIFESEKSLKWVGFEKPPKLIPKGTLIRVSLAKWWPPRYKLEKYNAPHGCYLQISGWY